MGIKQQFETLKRNWLLILLLIVVVLIINNWNNPNAFSKLYSNEVGVASTTIGYADGARGGIGIVPPIYNDDFAPDVEDRLITRSASLTTEVERGEFWDREREFKQIILDNNGFILSENVNEQGQEDYEYLMGSYYIKIDSGKYVSVLNSLKDIGEVTSVNEQVSDITGGYTNTQIELEAEKARLERFKELLASATRVEDKITITNTIFEQERTIKYLEQALESQGKKVSYATIWFTMQEEQSDFQGIVLITFGELARALVQSINTLLRWLFVLVPYAIVIGVIWFAVRRFKGNSKR